MSDRKLTEIEQDEDLEKAKQAVLADLLGKQEPKAKIDWSNRKLPLAQRVALRHLEQGTAFEVITRTIEFGNDEVDPVTKQVRPYAKQKGVVVTLEMGPGDKGWIEHLMKALQDVPLKKSEIELIKKHMIRLNYEGELRDYYEFYGLTLKELKEKEQAERLSGNIPKADRLLEVIKRNE